MKCHDVRDLLPELAGGELGPRQQARCEAHLSTCPSCRDELDGLRRAVSLLRSAGEAQEVPSGFAAALHRRLAAEPPPPPASLLQRLRGAIAERLRVGPALGLALSGALALLVVVPTAALWPRAHPGAEAEDAVAPFAVPQRRVAVVHLDFVTNEVVDDVEFEVRLPQGLAFISDGKPLAQDTLRWSGSLKAGSNPIPLAVSGNRPGRYRIVARARAAGLAVDHDVVLQVIPS